MVKQVDLLESNPNYVFIRTAEGHETTVSTRYLPPLPGRNYNLQDWDDSELIERNDTIDIESESRLQEIDPSIRIEAEYPNQTTLIPEAKIDLDITPDSLPSSESIKGTQLSPLVLPEINLQPSPQTRESIPNRMITHSNDPQPMVLRSG